MGLSGSKKKVSNDPWKPAQPFILNNLKQTQATYDQNQPQLQGYADMQKDTYGRVAPGAEAGINAAQNLVSQNLSGANLGGNPYIEGIMAKTNAAVTAGVNDQFGGAGRFGSGYHAKILGDTLAGADNELLFNNYNTQLQAQQAAIGQSQQLMGGSQSLLNNAAELPWVGTNAANGGIRQASNGYGTQTTTQSGGVGSMLGGIVGAGLSGWAGGGFKGV